MKMSETPKTDIMRLLPDEIAELISGEPYSQPAYRAKQIFSWLSRGVGFDGMSNLPKSLREALYQNCIIKLPAIADKLVSAVDGTVKYLFRLHDGHLIEAVLMSYEHGYTLCVSSQVGCRMGCRFCASTKSGRVRDLSASEILGEVIAAGLDAGVRVSNIVMMGIGEPLDNFDETVRFLRLVSHPDGLSVGLRHISVSTCGIVPRIRELAALELPVTLSISLHASDDAERSATMPINDAYPIEELMSACRDWFLDTGRRISFEYTLISGKNDSAASARRLAALLTSRMRDGGRTLPLHVNLIPLNDVADTGLHRTAAQNVEIFRKTLAAHGVNATVRRRLGPDIEAACGQLRIDRERGERTEGERI